MANISNWSPRLLSVLRIIAGLLFMCHGGQKLFNCPPAAQPMHIPIFSFPAGIGGLLEFFGGLLIVLGLFTRLVAFILSGEMAAAYFMAHASAGFWPINNHGELAVLYCFVFLYFAAAGAGPLSLDYLVRRKT
jgi:putative oxidoreductase